MAGWPFWDTAKTKDCFICLDKIITQVEDDNTAVHCTRCTKCDCLIVWWSGCATESTATVSTINCLASKQLKKKSLNALLDGNDNGTRPIEIEASNEIWLWAAFPPINAPAQVFLIASRGLPISLPLEWSNRSPPHLLSFLHLHYSSKSDSVISILSFYQQTLL